MTSRAERGSASLSPASSRTHSGAARARIARGTRLAVRARLARALIRASRTDARQAGRPALPAGLRAPARADRRSAPAGRAGARRRAIPTRSARRGAPRSSTRARRSASRSPCSRSSRRIVWPERPRTSARLRATGTTWARIPSSIASPSAVGHVRLELGGSPGKLVECGSRAFERGGERGALGPPRAHLGDPRLRPVEDSRSMARDCSLAVGRSFADGRARLRPAAGADRPAAPRAARREPAARLRALGGAVRHRGFTDLPDGARRALPRRRERHPSGAGAAPCDAAGRGSGGGASARAARARAAGRRWRGRAASSVPGCGSARSSSRRASARGAGSCGSKVNRRARRRSRRTSSSAARRCGALPDGLRRRGRLGGRPHGRAPLHAASSWAGSISSESPSTSASTRSGRSRPTTLEEHRDPQRALRGRARCVGADPGGRARLRGRDDDRASPRVARARRAARGPHEASSSRRGSSSAASTRS